MANFPLLKINAELNFLSLIVSFAENSCYGLGFTSKEARVLSMATEEIFTYLCKNNKGCEINVSCNNGLYFVELKLRFSSSNFNPGAFNLTSKINIDDEKSLDEMGLVITGRMVDSFSMEEDGNDILISLLKYRSYPEAKLPEFEAGQVTNTKTCIPEKQEIELFAALLNKFEETEKLEPCFQSYLMLTDMIASGDLKARVLKGDSGMVVGGIFWKNMGRETIEMFGPFVYSQDEPEKLSAQLVDTCLETIGKGNYKGLLCRFPGKHFPVKYFEKIGSDSGQNIYFRELKEDTGAVSWVHPVLKDHISNLYNELFLPRQIITVSETENVSIENSVISSKLNRSSGNVVMRPVIFGKDFSDNLNEHLKLFKSENYSRIIFEIDLGINRHSMFIPALLENNFRPGFILPCGGKGDLLIFDYKNDSREGF